MKKFFVLSLVLAAIVASASFIQAGESIVLPFEAMVMGRDKMVETAINDLSGKLGVPKELIGIKDVTYEYNTTHSDNYLITTYPFQVNITLSYDIDYEYKLGIVGSSYEGMHPMDTSSEILYKDINYPMIIESPQIVAGILKKSQDNYWNILSVNELKPKWTPFSYYQEDTEDYNISFPVYTRVDCLDSSISLRLIYDPNGLLNQYEDKLVKITRVRGNTNSEWVSFSTPAEDVTCEEFHGNPYEPVYAQQKMLIKEGWNAVSLTVNKQGFTVENLIELINKSAVDIVVKLGIAGEDGSPWEIVDSKQLMVPGDVYWILSNSYGDIEITIDGTKIYEEQTLALNEGWDLFTIPTADNINTSVATYEGENQSVSNLNLTSCNINSTLFANGCEISEKKVYRLAGSGWEELSESATINPNDIIAVYVTKPAVIKLPAAQFNYTRERLPLPSIDLESGTGDILSLPILPATPVVPVVQE